MAVNITPALVVRQYEEHVRHGQLRFWGWQDNTLLDLRKSQFLAFEGGPFQANSLPHQYRVGAELEAISEAASGEDYLVSIKGRGSRSIAVGNETQVPDYRGLKGSPEQHIAGLDFTEQPHREVRMQPHEMARTGYRALSLRGHTQESIENEAKQQGRDVEEVISDLLEEVAADYAAFRCRILHNAGVPREKIFTHFTSPFREKIVRARESHPEFFDTAAAQTFHHG